MKRVILIFLLTVVSVFAEIKTELSSYKVITGAEGNIERVSSEQGLPGDILEYVFYIKNDTSEAIYNVNPIIPIPNGTTLIDDKIFPQNNFKVSLNGRDFLEFPIIQNGLEVPLSNYRAVLWEISQLNTGIDMNLKLQVKINSGN
ncbi:hypothetical protein [uncultured Cetobacterium sp.]|uniref:hypothetical protein n=1 Tax=uncultured Cetobacterium sp. TaxID=527638 RepID=UPI00260EC122|nr:hypothetical protein [uncultured Cetobacterium sp.]